MSENATPRPCIDRLEGRILFTKYSLTTLGFLGAAGPSSAYGYVESDFAINGSYLVGIRPKTAGGSELPFLALAAAKLKPTYLHQSSLFYRAAANGVNSAGTAVGFGEYLSDFDDEAVEWKKGQAILLGPGFANGINSAGEIVGTYDVNGGTEPVIFGKHITDIGVKGGLGGNGGDALAVNAGGEIVGQALTAGGEDHPFLYVSGKMTDLDPKSTTGTAYSINKTNVIVGTADGLPFIYNKGKLASLPISKTYSTRGGDAFAINDSGVVVGDDNNLNEIDNPDSPGAVEWVSNKEYDLNKLIPAGSGWTLTQAVSISNSGQIIAIGSNPDGFVESVLLTPKT